METNVCIFFILLVSTHAPIDSIFEEVEQDYIDSQKVTGKPGQPVALPRIILQDWNDYRVANRPGKYVRYQHDMIINKTLFDAMMESGNGRHKRNAVIGAALIWPRTVPYVIDDKFNSTWKIQILLAIQHITLLTCVEFKPREKEKNYVTFEATAAECTSEVGMVGGEQRINLAVPKCLKISTIVHEICHALGLYHEHMRNDRDDHVTIEDASILDGKLDQFSKMNLNEYDDHDKPYDYRSLMHYGKSYFAKRKNGTKLITIQPTDHNFTDVIGNAVGLSFLDVKILNAMYRCAADCKQKNCNPDEFLGKTCDCFCESIPDDAVTRCQSGGCMIDPEWKNEFDVITLDSNSTSDVIPHGEGILMFCQDTSSDVENYLECIHGKWKGQITPCIDKKCSVAYESNCRLIYSINGEPLNDSDQLEHGGQVEVSCRNPNTDTEATNVTCIDGKLIGQTPTTCPAADSKCPVIVNAIVTTTQQINIFKVICVDGYDRLIQGTTNKLTTDILTCDVIGRWRPAVPFCSPATCSVPPVDNGIVYKGAYTLPIGHAVESGDDVTLECKYGHVPDYIDIKCSFGKWVTGQFPYCTKVVCGKPPVVGTSFKPNRDDYVYKDKVRVRNCKKNKEFIGDETLTCLQDGTWSGKASCTNYCRYGKKGWEDIRSRKFRWDGFEMRASTFQECKDRCTRQKGFLCLSVSFGIVPGERRPKCFLHRIDLNKPLQDNELIQNYRWSVSKRKCY